MTWTLEEIGRFRTPRDGTVTMILRRESGWTVKTFIRHLISLKHSYISERFFDKHSVALF